MILDTISNIMLFICGAGSIYLVGTKGKYQKYGYLVGIIGQPFWFYISYKTGQVGLFLVCFVYLYSWINGFRNHFLNK